MWPVADDIELMAHQWNIQVAAISIPVCVRSAFLEHSDCVLTVLMVLTAPGEDPGSNKERGEQRCPQGSRRAPEHSEGVKQSAKDARASVGGVFPLAGSQSRFGGESDVFLNDVQIRRVSDDFDFVDLSQCLNSGNLVSYIDGCISASKLGCVGLEG